MRFRHLGVLYLCQVCCGCGPTAAERWSELPEEERKQLTIQNLAEGEIHVAQSEEDSTAVASLPKGTAYRAFGEIRLKDQKTSMLGAAIAKVYELRTDGKKSLRDNFAFAFEQKQPGVYQFDVPLQPIAMPGRYSVEIDDLGIILAVGEFTVE